jgi:peptidoglycan/LPS O-acetylase OafA/YrhL
MATGSTGSERLHALDAVRGLALFCGVVYHAAGFYIRAPYPGLDSRPSLALTTLAFVLHVFRMTTFFVIAGFFARMTLEKRGTGPFVRDRARRLGIPLVVGWPLIYALIEAAQGKVPALPEGGLRALPLRHLWFLYVLLGLIVAAVFARAFTVRWLPRVLGAFADRLVATLVRSPLGAVALGAPTALALFVAPRWRMWHGIPTPDHLVPNLAGLLAFATAFAFGWLLQRRADLLEVWRQRWAANLAAAVVFTVTSLALLGGPTHIKRYGALDGATLAYAGAYTLAVWTWTFAFVGIALRFLAKPSPPRRYLADASYWVYLVHPPVLIAIQRISGPIDLPWFVKFPVVLTVAHVFLFATYHVFVRSTVIGAVLNGARKPWGIRAGAREVAGAAPAFASPAIAPRPKATA